MPAAKTRALETPVLIVGGGPTGLCASIALSRLGVSSVLVEKHRSTSPFPRTRAVHRKAMEIFRRWGLEESVHARDLDLEPVMVWAESVAGPVLRRQDYVPRSNPDLSPCRMSTIFQQDLEPLLLKRASSEEIADLRFSTELNSLAITGDGVEATLKHRVSGVESRVRASYLIAADGANSFVRDHLNVSMSGPDHLAENLLIRFRADLSRWAGPRPPYFYFLLGPHVRALYMTSSDHQWVLNAEDPELAGNPVEAVRAAIGADEPIKVLGEPAIWTTGAQVADSFRVGPVFLAGDAAHRLTPVGGMGMNTGVHDIHNLAWKLAAVIDGWAGQGLLDTYEPERRPAAARNVEWSLDNWNALVGGKPWPPAGRPNTEEIDLGGCYESAAIVSDGTPPPEPSIEHIPIARPGNRAPHVWIDTSDGRCSTVDLFDREFVLMTGPRGLHWINPAILSARSLAVPLRAIAVMEPEWQAAYGVASDGAVLVRPDGHVAWRSSRVATSDGVELNAHLAELVFRSMSAQGAN
jgi:putative polyketide hydroxylase